MPAIDSHRWREINSHLDRALDLTPEARVAWLHELRKSDADLAAELEKLLTELNALNREGFLTGDPAKALMATPLAGQVVGAYTIESLIGSGGMGNVWLAHRNDGRFEGKAAVKLLNVALMGDRGEERFRREGNLLAKLTHPNIAHLLDAGVTPSGQAFIVIEYVDGQRIDRYCDEQQLDVEGRVRLFLSVLAAVAHAHANLIVHRDIKPSNILVTHDGTVKLLDFGIAKLLGDESGVALTHEGAQALTPEYAAPEQAMGGQITTATDTYSLGVLLYVLLSGLHPTVPASKSAADYLRALVETEPTRLSDSVTGTRASDPATISGIALNRKATPQGLRRKLRGDLDNIVAKALRKNPGERYDSITDFALDLQRFLDFKPVSARPDSIPYRAVKFARRNRGATIAALLTTIAIVAGLVGTVTQARRAQLERDRAVRELTYTEATTEFVRFLLTEGATEPFTTAQLLSRAAQSVDKQFSDQPDLHARLLFVIGDEYSDIRDFKAAEGILLRAREAARQGTDRSLQTVIDCALAALNMAKGNSAEARNAFEDIRQRLENEPDIDASTAADCYGQLAFYYRDLGDAKNAMMYARLALERFGTPRPGQRAAALVLRELLGDVTAMQGKRAEALVMYDELMRDAERMGRENTVQSLGFMSDFGVHLIRAGQLQRAADVHEQIIKSTAANGRVANRYLEANYAGVLVELGRYDEALKLSEHAMESASAGGNARALAYAQMTAASAACGAGDLKRCESLLTSARDAMPAIYPSTHRNFSILEYIGAQLALARNDPAAAHQQLLRSLKIADTSKEPDSRRIRVLSLLARTELQLGDRAAAMQHAEQAVKEAREDSRGFESTEWLGIALLAQGVVQNGVDDKAKGAATLREALTQLQGAMGDNAPATKEARELLAGALGQ